MLSQSSLRRPSGYTPIWKTTTVEAHTFEPTGEMRRILEYRGITPDREMVAHWQAGIRAWHGAPWFSSFSGMRGSAKPRRLME